MKRMTSNEYNPCFNCNFYSSCSHIRENSPVCPERARYDRLAAIEDILGDEYDMDRLRELVQADREGKMPKYTIGDTVYDRFGDAWEVTAAELHSMRAKNEWLYRCGHKGTDDYCALWHFEAFPSKEAALRREQDGNRI